MTTIIRSLAVAFVLMGTLNAVPAVAFVEEVVLPPTEVTAVIEAYDKEYDATVDAEIDIESLDLIGADPEDDVYVYLSESYTAEFDSKDAGSRTVTVCDVYLGGDSAYKYTLGDNTCITDDDVEITPLPVVVYVESAESKVYDGTTTADIEYTVGCSLYDGPMYVLVAVEIVCNMNTFIEGDDVSVEFDANFDNKNVGSEKTVTLTGLTLTGDDAGNYEPNTIDDPIVFYADITPRELTVTATGVDKVFDGNTIATVIFEDDRAEGDDITVSGTASFADPAIGADKLVTVTGVALSGTDADNYFMTNEGTLSTTASITEEESEPTYGSKGSKSKPTVLGASTIAQTTGTAGSQASYGSGAKPYQFLFDLYLGSTHADVSVLQQIFIDKGYLAISAPTGYFGPLTQAAAKKYQEAHPQIGFITGFVGPLTRGVLNQGLY